MGNHNRRIDRCETCRRRRVKCDEQRPSCSQCRKSHLICGGYAGIPFVDGMSQILKQPAPRPKHDAGSKESSHSPPENGTVSTLPHPLPKKSSSGRTRTLGRYADRMGRFYFPLSATPHGSVPEDDTFMTHMIDNLRSGPLRVVYRNSIPIDLNAPGSQQTMMNYCLLSLAKIVFGSKSVQPRLLHSGLQTYGRALQILNAALREANNRITYEVLVSVFVLGLCEATFPMGQNSWEAHLEGLERIFAARGPMNANNSSYPELSLLEACRPVMIVRAYFSRKPSVMARPEWWASLSCSPFSSTLSYLMGHLARIPVLLQARLQSRQLPSGSDQSKELTEKVWKEWASLYTSLENHKNLWNTENLIRACRSEDLIAPNTWTEDFEFPTFETANCFILYLVVRILLLTMPLSLIADGLLPGTESQVYALVPDRHQSTLDIKSSALDICRSLHYQYQLCVSEKQPDFHVFFPMQVVRRVMYYLGTPFERKRLEDLYNTLISKTPHRLWVCLEMSDDFLGFCKESFETPFMIVDDHTNPAVVVSRVELAAE